MKQQRSDRNIGLGQLKSVPKRQLDLKKSRTPSTRPANCQSNTVTHSARGSKDFLTDKTHQDSSVDLNSSRRNLTTSRSNQHSIKGSSQNSKSKRAILTVKALQKLTKKKIKTPVNETADQAFSIKINEFTH